MASKAVGYIIGIIVILALIYIVVSISSKPVSTVPSVTSTVAPVTSYVAPGTLALMLTDPAQVPAGTEYLNVTFSGAKLHEAGASNSTGFINVNSTGTLNLLSLLNVSQTIGVAHVNASQKFDMIILNVSSSTIDINGTVYNVTLPSHELVVHIKSLNGTSGAALIDLSPTIVQIYSPNQTIFVMVPSVTAVAVGNTTVNSTFIHIGAKFGLKQHEAQELHFIAPNISITNAYLNITGNHTALGFTVKNNGNATVQLNHALLFGLMMANFNPMSKGMPAQSRIYQAGFNGNASAYSASGLPANISIGEAENITSTFGSLASKYGFNISRVISGMASSNGMAGIFANLSAHGFNLSNMSNASSFNSRFHTNINSSFFDGLKSNIDNKINASVMSSMHNFNFSNPMLKHDMEGASNFSMHYHNMLAFVISANGTLSLPFTESEAEGPLGYSIAAGSNATFTYNGPIGMGNSPMQIVPLLNQTYSLRVVGMQGAFASTNVTAS